MKNYIKFCNQNSLKPSSFRSLQAYKTKIMKETPEDKKKRLQQLKRAKLEQLQFLLNIQKINNAKKSN
tara:strand:- start:227 stop:430 length:204 start_codon:yes stop_codon:yes gene_type:complete